MHSELTYRLPLFFRNNEHFSHIASTNKMTPLKSWEVMVISVTPLLSCCSMFGIMDTWMWFQAQPWRIQSRKAPIQSGNLTEERQRCFLTRYEKVIQPLFVLRPVRLTQPACMVTVYNFICGKCVEIRQHQVNSAVCLVMLVTFWM